MNDSRRKHLIDELDAITMQLSTMELRNRRAPIEMEAVLRVAVAFPNLRFTAIAERCSTELGWRIDVGPGYVLRTCGIEDPEDRIRLTEHLGPLHRAFTSLLQSDEPTVIRKATDKLYESIDSRKLFSIVPGLARFLLMAQRDALCSSSDPSDREVGLRFRNLLEVMLIRPTAPIFRRILQRAAELQGQRQSVTINDRLSSMIRHAKDVAQPIERDTTETATDLHAMLTENADLRAALFGLQHELESLQEQIRALQSTSAADATARFLTELNAGAAGHLLDNIVFSSRAIRELEASGWIPEPIEVEGIVATITMLSDHLAHLGVQPIYEVGELAQIAMEDLSVIQYVGSEFGSPNELKTVRFKSPGWRYREQHIARAQAVEVASDSSASLA